MDVRRKMIIVIGEANEEREIYTCAYDRGNPGLNDICDQLVDQRF